MTTKMTFLPVLLGLLISCQQKETKDDPEKLKRVLFDYFEGIKARDLEKMNEVTTDDFVLFEDGRVWNNDSLMSQLNNFSKLTADFTFTDLTITVDHMSGSIRYFNHCACTFDTLTVNYNWIESATFIKAEEKWKMNFLHSTIRK
jgi:Domain of unknown function (DUF4440)